MEQQAIDSKSCGKPQLVPRNFTVSSFPEIRNYEGYTSRFSTISMGIAKTFYKGDQKIKDNVCYAYFHDITDCNCIIVTHANYPFIHTFHATPGSFGKDIDGDEIANFRSDIKTFFDDFDKGFNFIVSSNKPDMNFELDLYIVGQYVHGTRVDYMLEKLTSYDSIKKVNPKIIETDKRFDISRFDCHEVQISDSWKTTMVKKHRYIDISFFIKPIEGDHIRIEGYKDGKDVQEWY